MESMVYPPDLMVFDSNKNLLGRLLYDATPQETIDFLRSILQQHPQLKPNEFDFEDVYAHDKEFEQLRLRFDNGERAELTNSLMAWIEQQPSRSDDDALARNMLGACLYHMELWREAEFVWDEALKKYPNHPIKHRISYNRMPPCAYPTPVHSDLQGATEEPVVESAVFVPHPEVRRQNLANVESNSELIDLGIGVPFVHIPAGTFLMGGTPKAFFPRELPVRKVTITKPFLMSIWPVTRSMLHKWQSERWPGKQSTGLAGSLPADRVPYVEAVEYCNFISEQTDRSIRLPTEAEWEYASRGGLSDSIYPWGNEPPTRERCNADLRGPVPVASYPANGYGLFEMVGNIQEWCLDYFRNDTYQLTPIEVIDPSGPQPKEGYRDRVIRGGWSGTSFCQNTTRNSWRLGYHDRFTEAQVGFRLVCDISHPEQT